MKRNDEIRKAIRGKSGFRTIFGGLVIILEGANICPYLGNIIMTKLNCVTY